MSKLPLSYYIDNDVESIARSLLGKILFSRINNKVTAGIITETEAYKGIFDKASHAYGGRRTKRTEVMYKQGGISYVYLCYGVHYLLNVVTAGVDIPHAVLLRGIHPLIGIKYMLDRTGKAKADKYLTNGPGKITKAMGINIIHNNMSFQSDELWIENNNVDVKQHNIIAGPRIGVGYAAEDAFLPYRFILKLTQ
ncbi:MAG: 3-methyladenine DNA glycosylase [Bacteroidetes bacterium]|jgi:DNA-3-methyladenine glycosylase|nr:3-methyladenine DNA glycosylase [Bacteroidota bacterium]|tara:strand:+ start:507 stop:1091 length:585 start_codon:yes stop_codon:yes gene_type:complete